jgi:hypothetical protein
MLVDARVTGQPGSDVLPWTMDLPPARAVPLRSLIADVVRAEVVGFTDRERQRRLARVLTPADLDRGLAAGKVTPGGRQPSAPVDADAAVRTALEAFEEGRYFVFIDDQQIESLDQPVTVDRDTRLRFLRLVPLAGG